MFDNKTVFYKLTDDMKAIFYRHFVSQGNVILFNLYTFENIYKKDNCAFLLMKVHWRVIYKLKVLQRHTLIDHSRFLNINFKSIEVFKNCFGVYDI